MSNDYNEEALRRECLHYYSNLQSQVDKLNQALKARDGKMYDNNREHYEKIQFDKLTIIATNHAGTHPINGLNCVEGVILCKKFNLPAIYEMTLGTEGQIHYAAAKQNGYHPKVEEKEVEENAVNCPVLLMRAGRYYVLTKAALLQEQSEHEETEDTQYSSQSSEGMGL